MIWEAGPLRNHLEEVCMFGACDLILSLLLNSIQDMGCLLKH